MLVISRRPNDRILFPKLGITVHVVRVDGRSVRLGIEAPRNVHVLRHELAEHSYREPAESTPAQPGDLSHEERNGLREALFTLHLLQRKLELGQICSSAVESEVGEVTRQLEAIESQIAPLAQRTRFPGLARTALVVQDNANECELLAGFLRTCHYNVATARDGTDAMQYLSSHEKPDVVLLDMNIPREDGAATVHEIRSNPAWKGVRVIAMGGTAPPPTTDVGAQGVDCWFTKPIHPDELVAEIDRELAAG